jgi:predicted metal-dependent phosphoesterase TrpH
MEFYKEMTCMQESVAPVSFRFDTHVHTSEVSPCAEVPAREVVRLYKRAGYNGIVVTDHYNSWTLENFGVKNWARICDRYLAGYLAAREEGERVGLVVLPGLEITFDSVGYADFLVFGLDPEYLYHYPSLYKLGLQRFRELTSPLGCLVYQAHPFRPGITLANPAWIDGVEVYNGNPRHQSANRLALEFAKRHKLLESSGSDFHQKEDLARGGVRLPELPKDSTDFVRLLRETNPLPLIET